MEFIWVMCYLQLLGFDILNQERPLKEKTFIADENYISKFNGIQRNLCLFFSFLPSTNILAYLMCAKYYPRNWEYKTKIFTLTEFP